MKFYSRIKDKLITCIMAVVILIAYCNFNNALADGLRHTNIPTTLLPPMSTQQVLPEASFYKWASTDIVKAFKNNGLEVADVKPGHTLNPVTPQEGTIFLIPSFGENIGGYVTSYNSKDELKDAMIYYLQMNKDSASPAWYIFKKDNILVLISGKVPEEKTKQYENVLNNIGKK